MGGALAFKIGDRIFHVNGHSPLNIGDFDRVLQNSLDSKGMVIVESDRPVPFWVTLNNEDLEGGMTKDKTNCDAYSWDKTKIINAKFGIRIEKLTSNMEAYNAQSTTKKISIGDHILEIRDSKEVPPEVPPVPPWEKEATNYTPLSKWVDNKFDPKGCATMLVFPYTD